MIDRKQAVADLVLEHSECAAIFQRNRIDFCCQGERSIEEAAEKRGLDMDTLVAELEAAIAARKGAGGFDPRALTTAQLVGHIVSRHHEYLRDALPFVRKLSTKVSRVHGEHDPRLVELDAIVAALDAALIPHLDEEENNLFPALTAEEVDAELASKELASMHEEHLEVGALLEKMRNTTQDFATPDWACNSYRTLFSELEQLEGDVLTHVHLETHVLMPRFV